MTSATDRVFVDSLAQFANTPLPPEPLRHRVHGAADAESFLAMGRQCT
jgi:hypothetical protein